MSRPDSRYQSSSGSDQGVAPGSPLPAGCPSGLIKPRVSQRSVGAHHVWWRAQAAAADSPRGGSSPRMPPNLKAMEGQRLRSPDPLASCLSLVLSSPHRAGVRSGIAKYRRSVRKPKNQKQKADTHKNHSNPFPSCGAISPVARGSSKHTLSSATFSSFIKSVTLLVSARNDSVRAPRLTSCSAAGRGAQSKVRYEGICQ